VLPNKAPKNLYMKKQPISLLPERLNEYPIVA